MKKKLIIVGIVLFVFGICNVNAKINLTEIPSRSYVVGEYLFTRVPLGDFNGSLKTDYIIQASKSLNEAKIYYKSAAGDLVDILTGEKIEDVGQKTILERELLQNIRYYNLREIPEVNLTYWSNGIEVDRQNFSIMIERSYSDMDEFNDLDIKWDLYGSNISGNDYVLFMRDIVSTNYYENGLNLGSIFSYIAHPFIENQYEEQYEKIPLMDTLPLNVVSGATINNEIVNNVMNVSINNLSNYKIDEIVMYASEPVTYQDNHINMHDLLEFSATSDSFRTYIDEYYIDSFKDLSSIRSKADEYHHDQTKKWWLADVFIPIGDAQVTSASIGDFGNYEKREHDYYTDAIVSLTGVESNLPGIINDGTIKINLTSIDNPIHGNVYQEEAASNMDYLDHYSIYSMIAQCASSSLLNY